MGTCSIALMVAGCVANDARVCTSDSRVLARTMRESANSEQRKAAQDTTNCSHSEMVYRLSKVLPKRNFKLSSSDAIIMAATLN